MVSLPYPSGSGCVTFIRDHPPTDLPPGHVVALNPLALAGAQQRGLAASVPDDHFDRRTLLADQTDYLSWLLGWLDRLDARAGQGRGIPRLAAHFLTTAVDSLVVGTRVLRAVVDALEPERLAYGAPASTALDRPLTDDLQFRPRLGDLPLAARILPLIAQDIGLHYQTFPSLPVVLKPSPARPHAARSLLRTIPAALRSRMAPVRNLWSPVNSRSGPDATLMLWQQGYGAGAFARAERHLGRRVLSIVRGESATNLLAPGPFGLRTIGPTVHWDPAPTLCEINVSDLLDEIDRWARLPGIGQLLQARMDLYLTQICPTILHAAEALGPQLLQERVRLVAVANPSTLEEHAVLAAAAFQGIPRRLCQHGDQAFSYDFWLSGQTNNAEEFAWSDPSLPADLQAGASRYGRPCPVFVGPGPRVTTLRRRGRRAAVRATIIHPRAICYVPAPFTADSYPVGSSYFQDSWYYRWQLALLDLMATEPALEFVWKALPAANETPDPIPQLLAERGLANVVYEVRPLPRVIGRMGKILMDYPSTGLFEAVHYRKPVLALYFPRFAEVRDAARVLFGPCLRPCHTEAAALDEVRTFLQAGTGEYRVPPQRLWHVPGLPPGGPLQTP